MGIVGALALGLDAERDAEFFGEVEQIVETRHALIGECWIEPAPGIELCQFGPVHCGDGSGPGCGAIEQPVMHQHRNAVPGEAQVGFQHGSPELDGEPKRGCRLFGRCNFVPAMSDDPSEHDGQAREPSHMMT